MSRARAVGSCLAAPVLAPAEQTTGAGLVAAYLTGRLFLADGMDESRKLAAA